MLRKTNQRTFSRPSFAKLAAIWIVASVVLSGCSLLPMEEESMQPPLIQPMEEELNLVQAVKGNIQTYLKGTARFVSAATEEVSFKESGGRVRSVNVAVGDRVKAGDVLVELESGDLDLQLRLQKMNVEKGWLLYTQSKSADASATDLRLREIELEREVLLLESMESRMEHSRLYAPIDGIVTFAETLQAGDTVSAHQSVMTIADPARIELIYTAGSSKDLMMVEAGMPVQLRYKGKDYGGTVLQTPANAPLTADEIQAERNAVMLIVGMEKQPEDVQIGHSAEMTIELQNRADVILLPRSAVRSYMGRSYVQIADGSQRKEIDIEVGLTTATEAEIVRGLEEGQMVIVNH
ncbi:efflux RND transporter periplasmic adaptor subunit [Paenibacillus sp. CAU 1782]